MANRGGVEIVIYGAEQICASCVNLPSSKDTYEWLEAAIARKFPGQPFEISYVDIYPALTGSKTPTSRLQ